MIGTQRRLDDALERSEDSEKLNTANVMANGSITGEPVSDEDPAYVNCEAAQCDLTLDKQCAVVQPPSAGLECEAKIAATLLRYTGPDVPDATVTFEGKADGNA